LESGFSNRNDNLDDCAINYSVSASSFVVRYSANQAVADISERKFYVRTRVARTDGELADIVYRFREDTLRGGLQLEVLDLRPAAPRPPAGAPPS